MGLKAFALLHLDLICDDIMMFLKDTECFTKNDTKVFAYQIGQKASSDLGHVAILIFFLCPLREFIYQPSLDNNSNNRFPETVILVGFQAP